MQNSDYKWALGLDCGVTVCDGQGVIIYINEKAAATFASFGDKLVGRSLFEFHGDRSTELIRKMLSEGSSNSYTIEKSGIHKLIVQMPWFDNDRVAGLVELSMVTPSELPHYIRK